LHFGTPGLGVAPLSVPDRRTMVVANAGDDTTSLIDIPTLGVSAPISIHRATAPKPVPKNQKLNVRISNDGRCAWHLTS